ncbi:dihydroneopterin aldolase family protein [Dorcoceras hygrometricum]|uniref:dihydroneopterin aldolase n=1 Tax=Dorcoceras hygrometricum TaxID=472368 RepID=A0A2Z7CPH5_9LAMI|nr:dihydroneopterin aldolase family protein [Dorcoceras hygrometricum]
MNNSIIGYGVDPATGRFRARTGGSGSGSGSVNPGTGTVRTVPACYLAGTCAWLQPVFQEPGASRLIAVVTSIQSTTRSETPSSDCTRSPDEISTIGFSTSNWPEQISGDDRRRAAAAVGQIVNRNRSVFTPVRSWSGSKPVAPVNRPVDPGPVPVRYSLFDYEFFGGFRTVFDGALLKPSLLLVAVAAYTEIPKGDKLILRGLKFHGYHGVYPEERVLGQKFLVDVDAWMDLQAAGNSDDISDTVSYTTIYRLFPSTQTMKNTVDARRLHPVLFFNKSVLISDCDAIIIKEIVEGTPHNLVESVAQLIASTTLSKFPEISAVRVQVGKPHVAVIGPLDYLGVEIIRHRKNEGQS